MQDIQLSWVQQDYKIYEKDICGIIPFPVAILIN